jgi:hypothetical protein
LSAAVARITDGPDQRPAETRLARHHGTIEQGYRHVGTANTARHEDVELDLFERGHTTLDPILESSRF